MVFNLQKVKDAYLEHWENIYKTKSPNEVSWTQQFPSISASFFETCALTKKSKLVDIGCGEDGMVPYWLENGFENITALDLSNTALTKLKARIMQYAHHVNFVNTSILNYQPHNKIDFWHDRAVFHFLTDDKAINAYVNLVNSFVTQYVCIATFASDGPEKCSGLPIKRYNSEELTNLFAQNFELVQSQTSTHITPFNTKQSFVHCLFKRKSKLLSNDATI